MLPFVVIFLLAGLGLTYAGHKLEADARRSASWPVTPGQLESCEVVEIPRVGGSDTFSSWELRLKYSYVVRGITYRSTRYAFGYGDGRDDKPHCSIAAALKSKSQLSVHYDPAHPSEAVINTQPQTNVTTLGYAGLAMALISALFGFAGHW